MCEHSEMHGGLRATLLADLHLLRRKIKLIQRNQLLKQLHLGCAIHIAVR